MSKTWVLDTETKGTGAQMVPLEKILSKGQRRPELNFVQLERPAAPKPAAAPQAPQPRRFKVLDLMTRETLIEDADTRSTLELLDGVRSIVDVQVYAWSCERRRWRLLGLDEQRALWDLRSAPAPSSRVA